MKLFAYAFAGRGEEDLLGDELVADDFLVIGATHHGDDSDDDEARGRHGGD
jgi:hypothetical protein